MNLQSLLFRRSLVRWRFLVPLVLVLAALTAVPLLLAGTADTATATGSAAFVQDRPARAGAIRVQEDLDRTSTTQARAVTTAITRHFPDHLVDVTWAAHTSTDLPDGRALDVAAVPDLPRVARLTAGTWDGTATGADVAGTLQQDAARRLGVSVGSTVTVGDPGDPVVVRVVGTWRADDPGAARWFGAADVGSGRDGAEVGPLVVAAHDLDVVPGPATATWTVTPSGARLTPADVGALRQGIAAVRTASSGGSSVLADADLAGTLDTTLVDLQAADRTAAAVVDVALAVVAVVGTLTVALLATLVARSRADEDRLLTARGASTAQRLRWAVAEGLGVGVLGAVTGVAVRVVSGVVTVDGPGPAQVARVLVVAAAVVSVAVVSSGGAAVRTGQRDRTGRTDRWAAAPAVLLTAGAGFAVWRLSSGGAPVRVTDGGVVLDPVASAAPVAVVLACATVAVLLVLVASRVAARAVRRTRRLLPALTVRRLARGWSAVSPVVVTVVVAVSTGGFAAGFAATSTAAEQATATSVVGPPVRVLADGDAVVSEDTPDQDLDDRPAGATTVTPVLTDSVRTGGTDVPLVAVPRSAVALAVPSLDARTAAALRRDRAGVPVPRGASRVTVDVRSAVPTLAGAARPDAAGSLRFTLWVGDGDGVVRSLALTGADGGRVPTGTGATLSTTLPPGAHRWRALAVVPDLTFSTRPMDADPGYGTARLRVAVDAALRGVDGATGNAVVEDLVDAPALRFGAPPAAGRLPVVVSAATAGVLGAHVGTGLDLALASTSATVRARVVAVVPRVAGTAARAGIVADLPSLTDASVLGGGAVRGTPGTAPRVDETWITSSDVAATTAAVERSLPTSGSVVAASSASAVGVVDAARAVLAGVAALAAVLAALVVVAVAVVTSRTAPTTVLRSLGVRPRAAATARAAEVAVPALAALLLGLVGAVAVVAATAGPFALGAVPTSLGLVDVVPSAAVGDVLLVPAALAVVTAVTAAVAASAVRRRVARTTDGVDR